MSIEKTLAQWAQPPSTTEQDRCDHAASQIRNAIGDSKALEGYKIKVFAQGSYRNRTNVRQDSDVDICVLCTGIYNVDYSMSNKLTDKDVGLIDASYTQSQLKNDVLNALVKHFGKANVQRGNKAIDVRENSYRVDADVVACFEHRRYSGKPTGDISHATGTALLSDSGDMIINWPEQNYTNGVIKNTETNRSFKPCVRILKNLRNDMEDEGITQAMNISSFLLESLAWNAPNSSFKHKSYTEDMESILVHLFNNTMNDDDCKEWGEINEFQYLFHPSQTWSRYQAHQFISAAWDYMGFG